MYLFIFVNIIPSALIKTKAPVAKHIAGTVVKMAKRIKGIWWYVYRFISYTEAPPDRAGKECILVRHISFYPYPIDFYSQIHIVLAKCQLEINISQDSTFLSKLSSFN